MIVSVLWEDQRSTEQRGFGPHELLVSCVADELRRERKKVEKLVESHPKKGVGNVRKALQLNCQRLARHGPVLAVVDRDKIRELWKVPGPMPPDCIPGIAQRFREDAPGDYDLVLLVENVETLVDAAASALNRTPASGKPTPGERDRVLATVAWGDPRQRQQVRGRCPSFERLVMRVAAAAGRAEE
jgi:hypothetical protein